MPLIDEAAEIGRNYGPCLTCGNGSVAPNEGSLCPDCLAKLKAKGAYYRPYMQVVRENVKRQPPKAPRSRRVR